MRLSKYDLVFEILKLSEPIVFLKVCKYIFRSLNTFFRRSNIEYKNI
jgi:hypothetical protein